MVKDAVNELHKEKNDTINYVFTDFYIYVP